MLMVASVGIELELNNRDKKMLTCIQGISASKIEDWASILHDHPISEAYKAAHKRMSFSPEDLFKMDWARNNDIRKGIFLTTALREASVDVGVRGMTWEATSGLYRDNELTPNRVMELAYGRRDSTHTEGSKAKWEAWEALHKDPNTTLAQLKYAYTDAFETGIIRPLNNQAGAFDGIIEDIISGRASQ
jgi:hypothetical protein